MGEYRTVTDPTKVAGRRVIAVIIDWIIMWVGYFGLFLLTADLTQIEDVPKGLGSSACDIFRTGSQGCATTTTNGSTTVWLFNNSAWVWASLFAVAYLIIVMWFAQGLGGWSIGKLLVGIRIVNERGTGPGLGKQLIRGVVGIVDSLPWCTYIPLVGLITMFVSKGHRRVGDMAAKTFVVRSRDRGRPIMVPGLTDQAGAPAATPVPGSFTPTDPPVAAPTGPPVTGSVVAGTLVADQATPEPANTPAAGTPDAGSTPTAGGPQWDAERNAYIQWDETRQVWLTFDDATQEWKPIA